MGRPTRAGNDRSRLLLALLVLAAGLLAIARLGAAPVRDGRQEVPAPSRGVDLPEHGRA